MMKTRDLTGCALSAALIAICSWISIPAALPFTMQTFAIFLTAGIFGGKKAFLSMLLYLLLGMIGLPVFAGFKGGIGVILGTTGGYIFGFLLTALCLWLSEGWWKNHTMRFFISCLPALALCYLCGTFWMLLLYIQNSQPLSLAAVLSMCVIPFIVPDVIKIACAALLCKRFAGLHLFRS